MLQEYITLNYAEQVPQSELDKPIEVYYLPVHGVFKDSSSTTKVRAVFNASSRFLVAARSMTPYKPDLTSTHFSLMF